MKQVLKVFTLALIINSVQSIIPQQISAQQENEYYKIFFDQLNPFGRWADDAVYGSIWYPSVDESFIPYVSYGYWLVTEAGLTWVSDFGWGWAPFHYGRWDFDRANGWFWVPGYEWAPAWVLWRRAEGYYGWTAMRPNSTVNKFYDLPHEHWIFVKNNDIDRHDLAKIFVSRNNNTLIMGNSILIDRIHHDRRRQEYYFIGPSNEEIRRTIGRDIRTAKLVDREVPGHSLDSDRLQMYKPIMHHVDNDPVPASGAIEPPARVAENEKEKSTIEAHKRNRDAKNVKDILNAVENIIRKGSDRDRNSNQHISPPVSNTNRGSHPAQGNQNTGGVGTAPAGRSNPPVSNANRGQQPSSGNKNTGVSAQPSAGSTNSGQNNQGTISGAKKDDKQGNK